jgi:hypothetical protein
MKLKMTVIVVLLCFTTLSFAQKPIEVSDGTYTIGESLMEEGSYKITTDYPYAELTIYSDRDEFKTKRVALTNGKIEIPIENVLKEIEIFLYDGDNIVISMPYGTVKFTPTNNNR